MARYLGEALGEDLQNMKETGLWPWVKANKKKAALMAAVVVVGLAVLASLFFGTPLPPAAG